MALETGLWKGVQLVDRERGTVSRDIFVDQELYAIEQERVFARCWLFVGFADQIRKPGDFFVSRMGEESVILSRDRNNEIHVFLNSCRHRGMKVSRYDEGNTPVFTCPYHGWSYGQDGALVGVPRYKDAYREELDKSQWGLVEVAQMANFHGSIWATWDPKAPSFLDYIGDNEFGMSLWLNKPDGSEADIEVLGGIMKWLFPSNWKFGAENFLGDGYHGTPTHHSVEIVGINADGGQSRFSAGQRQVTEVSPNLHVIHHGSGRSSIKFVPEDLPYVAPYRNQPPVIEEYYRQAYERRKQVLGKNWRVTSQNGNIFPNATQGANTSMCVWHPHGPDWTECWRWYFVQRDMPQELKDLLRHLFMRWSGPGGMTESDDMENWVYAHKASKGVIAQRYPYEYSMGRVRERDRHPLLEEFGYPQNGTFTESMGTRDRANEQNQRGAYNFWEELMSSESCDDLRGKGLWR